MPNIKTRTYMQSKSAIIHVYVCVCVCVSDSKFSERITFTKTEIDREITRACNAYTRADKKQRFHERRRKREITH